MDWRIHYFDVSACMLFETIGDSETESNVNHNDDIDHGSSHGDTGLAEDDAFSCSCENEYYNDFDHPNTGTGDYVDVDDDQKEVQKEQSVDLGHEYDEEEDAVDQVRNDAYYKDSGDVKMVMKRNLEWEAEGGVMIKEAGQRTKKLGFLNEEGDNDRLFWETCLAS